MLCVQRLYCSLFLEGLIDHQVSEDQLVKYNQDKEHIEQIYELRKKWAAKNTDESRQVSVSLKSHIQQLLIQSPWYPLLVKKGWEVMVLIQDYLDKEGIYYRVCDVDQIKILDETIVLRDFCRDVNEFVNDELQCTLSIECF